MIFHFLLTLSNRAFQARNLKGKKNRKENKTERCFILLLIKCNKDIYKLFNFFELSVSSSYFSQSFQLKFDFYNPWAFRDSHLSDSSSAFSGFQISVL